MGGGRRAERTEQRGKGRKNGRRGVCIGKVEGEVYIGLMEGEVFIGKIKLKAWGEDGGGGLPHPSAPPLTPPLSLHPGVGGKRCVGRGEEGWRGV